MNTTLRTAVIAAALAAAAVSPASAVTYDAFTSFNGTQGAGNFFYGASNDDFSDGAAFAANTNCFIAGAVCLQALPNSDVPGVTKSTTTSFQYSSVNVPDDRLLLHPGPNALDGNVFAAFFAPTTGNYAFTANFSVLDIAPSGTIVSLRSIAMGGLITTLFSANLGAGSPTASFSGTQLLAPGEALLAVVNRNGSHGSDSTGLNFTINGVPEPASWALLIAGFGLTGAAMRRRRSLATA